MTTVGREEMLVLLSDGLRAADRLNRALIAHMARRFPNDVPSADVEKAMVEWETARAKLPSYDECQRLAAKPADDDVREALKDIPAEIWADKIERTTRTVVVRKADCYGSEMRSAHIDCFYDFEAKRLVTLLRAIAALSTKAKP